MRRQERLESKPHPGTALEHLCLASNQADKLPHGVIDRNGNRRPRFSFLPVNPSTRLDQQEESKGAGT